MDGSILPDNYYQSWTKKSLLKIGSPCRCVAILMLEDNHPDGIGVIIVEAGGEITCLSASDWSVVRSRGRVEPPPDENLVSSRFGIFHAAYDSNSNQIYFTLASLYDDSHIYWASLNAIAMDSPSPVPLDRLKMADSERDNRNFLGLNFDSKHRLLFACACNRDISLWKIKGFDEPIASLVTTIDCQSFTTQVDPRFCAFHIASKSSIELVKKFTSSLNPVKSASSDDVFILAVADFIYNKLSIYSIDANTFESSMKSGRFDDLQFKQESTILTNFNKARHSERDIVNGPCDICFDSKGRLLVADKTNDRLQVFVLCFGEGDCHCFSHDEINNLKLSLLWRSNSNSSAAIPAVWRLGFGVNPRSGRPSAIAASPTSEIFYFDC